jgi:hypothetical protein
MTKKSSEGERSLPKFSGFERGARLPPLPNQEPEGPASGRGAEDGAPLASLIGQAIRDSPLAAPEPFAASPRAAVSEAGHEADGAANVLPGKLLLELRAAQDQLKSVSAPVHVTELGVPGPAESSPGAHGLAWQVGSAGAEEAGATPEVHPASLPRRLAQRAAAALAEQAEARLHALRQLSRRMRPRDWQRRYFVLLTLIHRHFFDRKIEQLLFIKTAGTGSHSVPHPDESTKKLFLYQGPISRKILYWALSALPASLKHYAFVDFDAGNGRTLLLAARLKFEHVKGYAYDPGSCEVLEMNLAQYSRSYMSCRDVRALRGDRDGLAIPTQPAVLFFPYSLSASHLDAILGQVSAAQTRKPQLLYLIFENSGREAGLDGMEIFERVRLPILDRVKVYLFSPAPVAVYKSAGDGTGG